MIELGRFFRHPKTIVWEVALLTASLALSTVLPGITGEAGLLGGAGESYPALTSAARFLGLDSLVTSFWFLGLLAAAAGSLSLMLADQVQRAWRLSRRAPTAAGLAQAPYRREQLFVGASLPGGPTSSVRVTGAPGAWGSPLFHLGLLVVILAGVLRLLFGADAVVDLMAGEELTVDSAQYGVQRPGLLAKPFTFPVPVQFDSLAVRRYPSGEVLAVEATLRVGEGPAARVHAIAINRPLKMGADSLYLRSVGGAAVLVVAGRGGVVVDRHALLLRDFAGGASAQVALSDGTLLRVASNGGGIGLVPQAVDLQALRGTALTASARLAPGGSVRLPDGTQVAVSAILPWAQFAGRRDISTPVVYIGFSLAFLGGLLMFAVVRVESAVVYEARDGGVGLIVLMRPQRFVPLFAPAFERLWVQSSAPLGSGLEGRES